MADVFDFYVYDDRSIQFTLAEPIMLEDKDVTQFRFRIPKSLNGFDMSDWEWWFIFVNPKGTKYTTLLELTDDEDEPDEYSVATYTVGYGFSGNVGTVRFSIEALNVSGEDIVNEWHTKTYSTAVIDTLQGLRAVIPEPDGQVSTGITEEVKQALLQIARKVAYIDEHGQTYYDALYNALYAVLSVNISPSSITLNAIGNTSQLTATTVPTGANVIWVSSDTSVATVSDNGLVTSVAWGSATITATAGNKTATCSVMVAQASVVAITADYNQSGTVYTTASLDDLKSDLTVSAEWNDGTSSIVADTDYTLSGTLTEGTSTVTVAYGGKTTTFTVTVTHAVAQYTITNNLTNCTNSNSATVINEETAYSGTLIATSGNVMSTVVITMSGTDITSTAYNSETGAINITSVTGNVVITAEAVEDVGWISGVPYDVEWTTGYRINNNTGATEENTTRDVSDFMPCRGVSALTYENIVANSNRVFYYYDSEMNYIYASYKGSGTATTMPPYPVPRNARYVRFVKASTTTNASVIPNKYPTLTESTAWVANQKYVLSYSEDTSADGNGNTTSDPALCYGATKLYTNLQNRSFVYFLDSEKGELSTVTIQNPSATYINVPEGAYYFKINPKQGAEKYDSNTNNPWVYME